MKKNISNSWSEAAEMHHNEKDHSTFYILPIEIDALGPSLSLSWEEFSITAAFLLVTYSQEANKNDGYFVQHWSSKMQWVKGEYLLKIKFHIEIGPFPLILEK